VPLTPVATPQYVAVPAFPGVPPMVRLEQVLDAVTILASDAAQIARAFGPPQWGIFDQFGVLLIQADSIAAIDYKREYRISDYPVEQGGFASYDKVAEPSDVRVTMVISGKGTLLSNLVTGGALGAIVTGVDMAANNRAQVLNTLEALAATLDLVTVITPEQTYAGLNVVHHDYRRDNRNGFSLLTVDVWLREVRLTATQQFTQTASASGADPQSAGNVQPATPSPAQAIAAGPAPL
jgi:hypothetical protein